MVYFAYVMMMIHVPEKNVGLSSNAKVLLTSVSEMI